MARTNEELGIEIEEMVELLKVIGSNLSSLHLRVTALEMKEAKSR